MSSDTAGTQKTGEPQVSAAHEVAGADTYFTATAIASSRRPSLTQDIDVDICVIGGGLAGLTTAYEMARRGWSVAVLEREQIAWNASGRNTGFVLPGFGQDIDKIIERVGPDHARELWMLSQSGVEYVRQTIAEGEMQGIEPSDGWLHVSKTDRVRQVTDEADLLRSLGADIEYWPESLVRSKLKSDRYFQAIHYPTAFNIHPVNYVVGLARLAEESGARIFEQTKALSIDPAGVRKRITTTGGRVRAARIVIAGNVHLGELMPELSQTLIPVQTFVIVTKPLGAALAEAIEYSGSVSDTDRADSHYRIVGGDRLMWCGRISVWDGNPRRFGRKLLRDMRRRFPQLAGAEVDYAWSGTLGLSVHRMPQIGELSPGVWLASGFGGHGINTTAMAGNLITRAIIEGDDRWRLFQPFELVWAGGRAGRLVLQASYWGQSQYERWASGRARENEVTRSRSDVTTDGTADSVARAPVDAEADAAGMTEKRSAAEALPPQAETVLQYEDGTVSEQQTDQSPSKQSGRRRWRDKN